ncbi:uncharacterized protein LOC104900986 isoform X1 [Beta vulgaris subsp. vulgaris]|uniref:uncharacterized protein LOC104900986 isoform X1 n=1 Tax=Beta vulgaris subsp. vulgaris TaxID=3555 RepID=UPI00053F8AE0|nr:uncharacterized protein LOC104900986 isoform X1 [Beta vulgaris subsp. vulgaris]
MAFFHSSITYYYNSIFRYVLNRQQHCGNLLIWANFGLYKMLLQLMQPPKKRELLQLQSSARTKIKHKGWGGNKLADTLVKSAKEKNLEANKFCISYDPPPKLY